MGPIKEAFQKVKEDIDSLKFEILTLKADLNEIKSINRTQQITPQTPTDRQIIPTHSNTPTDNYALYAPITPNNNVSIGNGGVPTDRQTDRQTDQHIPETLEKFALSEEIPHQEPQNLPQRFVYSLPFPEPKENPPIAQNPAEKLHFIQKESKIDHLEHVSEILNSLDFIKKDLRQKFKRLTQQEMIVFSTIYQLEEQGITVDYPTLASKLSLSESSIRDYLLKITKKGIPIIKTKENNKKIILQIPDDFKKIASLQTIISLREL